MSSLQCIMEYNKEFVNNKQYEKYVTDKIPKKKMAILSCMDTRLTELLPKAMNIKNGDAKIIKDAGATIMHPFGGVIGHHNCGMSNLDTKSLIDKIKNRGIKEDTFDILKYAGIDVEGWLYGFSCAEESIRESVKMIKNHPLFPKDVRVHGLIISPETGKLDIIINGDENK